MTRRASRMALAPGETQVASDGGGGNGSMIASTAGVESRRRTSWSDSKTSLSAVASPPSSTTTDHPRFPVRSSEKPACPKFSDPIQAARASTIAYFA